MPAKRILPSDSILEKWVKQGMTLEQIRQRVFQDSGYLPGKSTVSAALSRAGLTNPVRYDDFIPWPRISVDHNAHYILHQLRVGARLKRKLKVSDGDRRRYENWVKELHDANAIVTYDPNTIEGFFYVPREPGERGLTRL